MFRFLFGCFLIVFCGARVHAGNCDSVFVVQLSDLQNKYLAKKITKMLHTTESCIQFPFFEVSYQKECSPCKAILPIHADTNQLKFYLKIIGSDYVQVFRDEENISPQAVNGTEAYYEVIFPDTGTYNLKLEIFIEANKKFWLASLGNDLDNFKSNIQASSYELTMDHWYDGFLGTLFMLALLNIIWFLFNKRRDILIYAIYTTLLFLYFWAKRFGIAFFSEDSLQTFILCVQPVYFIAYTSFMMYFLESYSNYPKLHVWLKRLNYFLFINFILILLFQGLEWYSAVEYIFNFYRIVTAIAAISVIVYLIRFPSKVSRFIVYGGGFLLIGSVLAMVFTITNTDIGFMQPLYWMMLGTILELIFFSAGLGYRTQGVYLEKLFVQNKLIGQMKENEGLLNNRELALQQEVALARQQIETELQNKLSAEFSAKELEIELQSLRTQMNPHFIFNSLNSIKSFIIKNEPRIAADYLSKFAQLMRLILAHSKETTIPLSEELNAVKIYMELEQMRFNKKFNFQINVSDEIDVTKIFVQPLIIQPYIENAIWHGLMHLSEAGELILEINHKNDTLQITIEDNGVGREKAQTYESKLKKKKSFGTQITADRLRHFYGDNYEIEYIDKRNAEKSLGTMVRIKLPVKLKSHAY